MAERRDNQVLDCEVWTKLPQHLLERVLSMIPLDSLVALRVICKSWNVVVIPNAGRMRKKHSPSTTTMVFCINKCFEQDESEDLDVRPVWVDVEGRNLNTGQWSESPAQGSFGLPGVGEALRSGRNPSLCASEGGLLFFKLFPPECRVNKKYSEPDILFLKLLPPERRVNKECTEPDVLVCNPLTGHYKILCPPSLDPSLCPFYDEFLHPRLGVHFKTEDESYKLVVARFQRGGIFSYTLVYDSATSSWEHHVTHTGLLEDQEDSIEHLYGLDRGVCFHGDLYWKVLIWKKAHLRKKDTKSFAIMKYNLENDVMSRIKFQEDIPWPCGPPCFSYYQIVSGSGEVLLEVVQHSRPSEVKEFGLGGVSNLIASDDVLKKTFIGDQHFEHYQMDMPNMTEFPLNYFAFRHNNIFYIIIQSPQTSSFQILFHDAVNNSIREIIFPGTYHGFCNEYWAFSPSLTAFV